LICNDFDKAFGSDELDVLLTPVHNGPAMKYSEFMVDQENYEEFTLHDHCTMPANMAGE
jgi:Asp-tRNA(Asn)/Glu-tRNA(Gln) amidotransferase A subunit family amidase